jgi:putative transposon-encoded protein
MEMKKRRFINNKYLEASMKKIVEKIALIPFTHVA